MEATTTLREAVHAYAKARIQRQEAVQAIFDEIKDLITNSGLDADVIVHGSNSLNTLSIEVRLPDDRGVRVEDVQPSQESQDEPAPGVFITCLRKLRDCAPLASYRGVETSSSHSRG